MSHSTCLVIGNDPEGQLEPFNENLDEASPYTEFEDGENGGYWYNPNAKWDWYSLGGRWTGFFKVKNGAQGVLGQSGAFDNAPPPGNRADQALKKDIDFGGMRMQAKGEAVNAYDLFEEATKGLEPAPLWSDLRKRYTDIDEARAAYNGMAWVKALKEAKLDPFFEDAREVYCVDTGGREAFVQAAMDRAISTFAILNDGEWFQKGDMGLFGMSTDEMTQEEWDARVAELLDSLPDDALLSIYDLHI